MFVKKYMACKQEEKFSPLVCKSYFFYVNIFRYVIATCVVVIVLGENHRWRYVWQIRYFRQEHFKYILFLYYLFQEHREIYERLDDEKGSLVINIVCIFCRALINLGHRWLRRNSLRCYPTASSSILSLKILVQIL